MERQSTRKLFKLVIALVALFTLALSVFAFGACGGEAHQHDFKSISKTNPTCGTIGVETFKCDGCGEQYQLITPVTGSHKWDASGKYCETCGLPNFGADVTIPAFPEIPDGFTQKDLDDIKEAVQSAITTSEGNLTQAQKEAHEKYDKELADLQGSVDGVQGSVGDLQDAVDALEIVHTLVAKTPIEIPGTCTSYGFKITLSECSVCKATFLTSIERSAALGHTPGTKTTVEAPTCQDFGHWIIACTKCEIVLQEGDINTVPHEKGDKSTTESIAPSCTETGTDKFECKWCHKVQYEWNETVPATGHTMPEGSKPDDCTTAEGKLTYTCPVCEQSVTVDFDHDAHVWTYSNFQQTLCGETATVTRSCQNCKVVEEGVEITKDDTEIVTALGDQWSEEHPAHTNETEKVVYVPYKDRAGNSLKNWDDFKTANGLTDADDPANFDPEDTGYNAENNVVKYTYYECSACGQFIKINSEAETHNFRVDTESADWIGHELNDNGDPVAECVDYTAHWKCIDSSCKDLDISYDQLVKGEGHTWAGGAIDWTEETVVGKGELAFGWTFKKTAEGKDMVSSCTEVGKAYRYCTVCNADDEGNYDSTKSCGYEEHDVSTIDHVIDRDADTYTNVPATCTEAGYEEGPCAVCKQATVRNEFEKEEHEWAYDLNDTSKWEVVWGNDDRFPCRSTLVINYCTKCNPEGKNTDCEGYKSATIAGKVDHKWEVETVVKAPTCTDEGETTYVCTVCTITKTETTKPLGHLSTGDYRIGMKNANGEIVWNFGETAAEFQQLWAKYVDCKDYLYTREFCTRCGDWVNENDKPNELPLLPHEKTVRPELKELQKTLSREELEAYIAEHGVFVQYTEEPTCTKDGWSAYVCSECGDYFEKTTIPAKHNLKLYIYDCTDADCEDNLWKCENCDYTKPLEEGDFEFRDDHAFKLIDFQQGKECGSPATFTIACEYCTKVADDYGTIIITAEEYAELLKDETENEIILELLKLNGYRAEHNFDGAQVGETKYIIAQYITDEEYLAAWNKLDAKNCNTLKVVTKACSVCGKTIEEYSAEQHNWSSDPVWEETLEDAPESVQTALEDKVFSKELVDFVEGHYYVKAHSDTVVTIYWYCNDSSCVGLLATLEVKWDGEHDWSNDAEWDENWTYGEAKAHGWIPSADSAPVCDEVVTFTRECTVQGCDAIDSETHVMKGVHDYGETPTDSNVVKHPHLNEDGLQIDTYTCSICGETKEVEVKITATGDHDWLTNPDGSIKWFIDWNGDCTLPSTWHKVCAFPGCGATVSVNGPALGEHKWVEGHSDATCTTPELTYNYCERCGKIDEASKVEGAPATGHIWETEDGTTETPAKKYVITYPTCTTDGTFAYKCTVCGQQVIQEPDEDNNLKATGHNFVVVEEIKIPATCTERGLVYEQCEYCGLQRLKEFIPANGHTLSSAAGFKNENGIIVWSNEDHAQYLELAANSIKCRDIIYSREYCTVCGWTGEISEIQPLPHEWQWREDWDELGEEAQLKALEAGDIYKKVTIVEPTCENPGSYGYVCKNCGEVVYAGSIPQLGHWYYTISKEDAEAQGITKEDLEANYLNIVGKDASGCLAPNSVTVECTVCGVRYAYGGSGSGIEGHTWKLIVDAGAQVLCGEHRNTKSLAYCDKCGYVIDLTGRANLVIAEDGTVTFDKSATYATYLGKANLDKAQLAALEALLDENGLLDVNRTDVVKPDAPAATADPAETPAETYEPKELRDLVVNAFQSDEIQTHVFIDKPEYRVLLKKGTCTTPTAYVVVCSICGLNEEGEPVIKLDTQDYKDYLWTKRPTTGSTATFWDDLGYDNFNKGFLETYEYDLDGDGEAESVTNYQLYQAFVAEYLETKGLTAEAEAFATLKKNVRYTGFNFTLFNFEENGHVLLTDNEVCELDPILQLLLEDYVGNTTNNAQTYGIILKGANNHSEGITNGNYFVNGEPRSIKARLNEFVGVKALTQVQLDAILKAYPEFNDPIPEEYKVVVDYLVSLKGADAATLKTLATTGVSNWCKNSALEGSDCDLPKGFVAKVDHDIVYNIYVDKLGDSKLFFGQNSEGTSKAVNFTLGTGALDPESWETAEDVKAIANDLRFVQWLIDNKAAAAENELVSDYLTTYADILDQNVLSGNDPTCIVMQLCSRKCGYVPVLGHHQYDINDPVYGINCQHGATCTACGEYFGGEGDHRLVDVTNEDFQADEDFMAALEALLTEAAKATKATDLLYPFKDLDMDSFVAHGAEDPTCWAKGKGAVKTTLTICVGCLEAWYHDTLNSLTGDKATWITQAWTENTNYTKKTSKPTDPEAIPHTFVLSEENVLDLAKLFKGVEGATFLEDVDFEDEENIDAEVLLEAVKAFVDDIKFTFTSGQSMPAGTVTPELDEEGYLVIHYAQESDNKVCQGTAWDEDLCWACAIHQAIEAKGAAVSVNDKSKTIAVRSDTTDKDGTYTTETHKTATNGKYNDQGAAKFHVYAQKLGTEPWVDAKTGDTKITVVCLRCDKWDDDNGNIDGSVKGWIEGDKQGSFFFVQNKEELDGEGRLAETIDDAADLYAKFDTKAQNYSGTYHYAATNEAAASSLTDAITNGKGGIVELGAGVEGTLTVSAERNQHVINKNTTIKLAADAKLTLDTSDSQITIPAGKTLTIEGGTVEASEQKENNAADFQVGAGSSFQWSTLTLNGTHLVLANGITFGQRSKLIVKNCVIESLAENEKQGDLIGTNHNDSNGASIDIEDTTIVAKSTNGSAALVVNRDNVTVTAKNSTFYSNYAPVWVRSGKATFTDCTFITGGNRVEANAAFSGTSSSGGSMKKEAYAALVVGSDQGTYGNATVTVNGEDTQVIRGSEDSVVWDTATKTFTKCEDAADADSKKFAVGAAAGETVTVTFGSKTVADKFLGTTTIKTDNHTITNLAENQNYFKAETGTITVQYIDGESNTQITPSASNYAEITG